MINLDSIRSSFDFINDIKGIRDNNERAIYIFRYASIAAGIFVCIAMIYFGTAGAGYLSKVFESFKARDYNEKLYTDVRQLDSNESRINTVLQRIDSMKYPSRDTLRADINVDFEKAGLEVRSFTPVEIEADIQKKGTRRAAVTTKDTVMSDIIEVEVTGRIKTERLFDFLSLFDRKDRFWYLSSMTVRAPEGSADFFSRAYSRLDADRRSELFTLYEQGDDREYTTVAFSFRTFVRQQ